MAMKTIEIDEVELQRSTTAVNFLNNLWRNPKARRKVLEAQREVKPDDPMLKELETPDPLDSRFEALQKELADEKKARQEAEAKREQDEKLSTLKRTRDDGIAALKRDGWTADGIKAVEEIMDKKGILDPLDAAAIYERSNPPQAPIMPNGTGGWNFMEAPAENDDLKKLIETKGESNPLIDKMAREALAEVRGSTPRR